jgi:putative ATP-dependent endonuclease of OLD family
LDVTRAEILFAKGVVLVEGIAEQFLVPAFAAQYLHDAGKGSSLDEYGIAVCSVSGTDFVPYHKLLSNSGLGIPNVIVTDGDPSEDKGKKTYAGLARGIRLIENAEVRNAISQMVIDAEFEPATAELEKHNIFVGDTTLELELLSNFQAAMRETYAELNSSDVARKRFDAAAEGALKQEGEPMGDVIGRISTIGKGRFAQRLAQKIGVDEPPRYLRNAIEKIVQLVEQSHARPEPRVRPAK